VQEIQKQSVKSFEDPAVQDELLELYREREMGERFEQLAKQLDELSFDYPESLTPLAEATGLTVKTTDWMSRSDTTGIGEQPAVIEAAFSSAVLDNKENSSPLKLAADRLVVLRVAEHEPAKQRPLDEVADKIRETLKQEYAMKRSQQEADAAMQKLRDGENLRTVANSLGLVAKSPGWIERDTQSVDAVLVQRVFSLPRPAEDASEFAQMVSKDGQAIVVLQAVRDGDPATASQEEREALQRNLLAAQSQAEFRAYLDAARDDISVEIHQDQL
jgi:peptidyl-prolyl cis-trans isomerase D